MPDEKQLPLPMLGAVYTTNQREDAPTIYADSIQGAMVSPLVSKITFLEQFLKDDQTLSGRYVVNIVLPTPQLRAVGDLLHRLADDLDQQVQANQVNGE